MNAKKNKPPKPKSGIINKSGSPALPKGKQLTKEQKSDSTQATTKTPPTQTGHRAIGAVPPSNQNQLRLAEGTPPSNKLSFDATGKGTSVQTGNSGTRAKLMVQDNRVSDLGTKLADKVSGVGDWLTDKISGTGDWLTDKATDVKDWTANKVCDTKEQEFKEGDAKKGLAGVRDWVGDKISGVEDWISEKDGMELLRDAGTVSLAMMLTRAKRSKPEQDEDFEASSELLEALGDPYGSLYLEEGLHNEGLDLLEDLIEKNGGSIDYHAIFDKRNEDSQYLTATLERLLPMCDMDPNKFIDGLETSIVATGIENGADPLLLDEHMLEVITARSNIYAEQVQENKLFGFYKWQEKHKKFASILADITDEVVYDVVMGAATKPSGGSIDGNNRIIANADDMLDDVNPKTNFEAEKTMLGSDWNDYFRSTYGDNAVEWVSENVTDISRLNDTTNFRSGALEHILEGNINSRGQAVGFHYEGMPTQKGTVIQGTESMPNASGIYQGMVEISGIAKQGNGGYSTFFPKDLTPQQIVDVVNEAYTNRTFVVGSMNTYTGTTSSGIDVTMFLDKSDKIISAFPNY
jgi:hypothetical protein